MMHLWYNNEEQILDFFDILIFIYYFLTKQPL